MLHRRGEQNVNGLYSYRLLLSHMAMVDNAPWQCRGIAKV